MKCSNRTKTDCIRDWYKCRSVYGSE